MHCSHVYPGLRAMFRHLLVAVLIGVLVTLTITGFRRAMLSLGWLLLSNNTESLINVMTNLSPLRRILIPVLGGLAARLLLWSW